MSIIPLPNAIEPAIAAQHCLAADAAGAAPELGAIVGHDGAPALVPISGGRQRRR